MKIYQRAVYIWFKEHTNVTEEEYKIVLDDPIWVDPGYDMGSAEALVVVKDKIVNKYFKEIK